MNVQPRKQKSAPAASALDMSTPYLIPLSINTGIRLRIPATTPVSESMDASPASAFAHGDLRCPLDIHRGYRTQNKGHLVFSRRVRQYPRRARPNRPLQPDRCHTKRCCPFFVEKVHPKPHRFKGSDILRQKFDFPKPENIFVQIDLVIASTFKVFEGKTRDPAGSLPTQDVNTGISGQNSDIANELLLLS